MNEKFMQFCITIGILLVLAIALERFGEQQTIVAMIVGALVGRLSK